MTKKEVGKLIKKYILPTHFNYYLHKNILYKPFGGDIFIKGYSFGAGGRNPDAMHVSYFITPLFVVEDTISTSYSQELYYAYREGLFNLKRSRNQVWDVRIASRERTELLLSRSTQEERIGVLKEFANITISNLKLSHLMPITITSFADPHGNTYSEIEPENDDNE